MRLLIAICLVALVWNATPIRTVAQDAPPQEPPQIYDLKTALDATAWDSAEKGPILAINPSGVTHPQPKRVWQTPTEPFEPVYAPASGHGLRLETVARSFNRRVVQLPTLAVVVPREMMVLNTNFQSVDAFSGMSNREKLTVFEGALTPAEWRLFGSEGGLGVGDLPGNLQPLFLSLLPDPVRLTKQSLTPDTKNPDVPTHQIVGQYTLSDDERSQIRLRLNVTSDISLLDANRHRPIGPVVLRATSGEETYINDESAQSAPDSTRRGQPVRLTAPGKLKPGQLDFDLPALDTRIPLSSAKTVGDLVRLVRDKSTLDLYVDGRLAPLTVYVSGTNPSARAGDVLKALCWAVSGTVRKLSLPADPGAGRNADDVAYVLTYDVEGLQSQRALVGLQYTRERSSKNGVLLARSKALHASNAMQYLATATDDPMAPTVDNLRRIIDSWDQPDPVIGSFATDVAVDELSPARKAVAQRTIHGEMERQGQNPGMYRDGLSPDHVRVAMTLELCYMVPGVGTLRSPACRHIDSSFLPNPSATVLRQGSGHFAPLALDDAIVSIAPKSGEDVVAVMDVARAKGVHQMWLQVSEDDTGRTLVADAAGAGKSRGIAVYALVSLMREEAPAGKSASATSGISSIDLNIMGETGDVAMTRFGKEPDPGDEWLRSVLKSESFSSAPDPEAPGTLPTLDQRLATVAGIPGIAGLVLKDIAAPGHQWEPERASHGADVSFDFGYTMSNRIRFLRQEGYDPVDLPPNGRVSLQAELQNETALPYFDTDGSSQSLRILRSDFKDQAVLDRWHSLRVEQQKTLLKHLYVDFRRNNPALPVWVAGATALGCSTGALYAQWNDIWDLPEMSPVPLSKANFMAAKGILPVRPAVQKLFGYAFTPLTLEPETPEIRALAEPERTRAILDWLDKHDQLPPDTPTNQKASDVIDCTGLSIPETIRLLRDGFVDKTP